MLATGAGAAPRGLVARRLTFAVVASLLASAVASLAALGPVPASMWTGSAMWTKLGYAVGLGAACAWLAIRLAQPAAPAGAAPYALAAAVATMLLAGAMDLTNVPAAERRAHMAGHSAIRCPWAILLLSLPALLGLIHALRGLAPTRPHRAGLAAGLLSGAIGAAGYALSCTEEATAFIALWYSLGIALSGALGSVLGGRLLRW
jgi:hypothetical protein